MAENHPQGIVVQADRMRMKSLSRSKSQAIAVILLGGFLIPFILAVFQIHLAAYPSSMLVRHLALQMNDQSMRKATTLLLETSVDDSSEWINITNA